MRFLLFAFFQLLIVLNVYSQTDTTLANKLIEMARLDQEAMQSPPGNLKLAGSEHLKYIDSIAEINYHRAKDIFDQYGYPGYDRVGEEGSKSFWLIVQHCDRWPEFQQEVLKEMEKQVLNNNAQSSYFAYLVDRVRKNSGRKQLYGTQLSYYRDNCQAYAADLEDPGNVNKRRKAVGLESLEKYLNMVSTNHFARNEEAFRKRGINGPTLYEEEENPIKSEENKRLLEEKTKK